MSRDGKIYREVSQTIWRGVGFKLWRGEGIAAMLAAFPLPGFCQKCYLAQRIMLFPLTCWMSIIFAIMFRRETSDPTDLRFMVIYSDELIEHLDIMIALSGGQDDEYRI